MMTNSDIEEADAEKIGRLLRGGEVIVYPTDTIYGLGCLATKEKAVNSVNKIKGRARGKSYIVLVDSVEMAKKYAKIDNNQEEYLEKVWPGPVTVVLESRKKLAKNMEKKDCSIAIRFPDSIFLQKIINAAKAPIVSTSVNKAGEPPFLDPSEIIEFFRERKVKPDLLIDAGRQRKKKPSKLVDIRNGNIVVFRN